MKLIMQLVDRAKDVDLRKNQIVPAMGLKPGEKVGGVLPDSLKCLYVVAVTMEQNLVARCGEAHSRIDKLMASGVKPLELVGEDKDFLVGHVRSHKDSDMAFNIFWHAVRAEFPDLLLAQNIGLRESWQVVSWNSAQQAVRELMEILQQVAGE